MWSPSCHEPHRVQDSTSDDNFSFSCIYAAPSGRIFGGGSDGWVSDDGGATWRPTSGPSCVSHNPVSGNLFGVSFREGVSRSADDGETWSSLFSDSLEFWGQLYIRASGELLVSTFSNRAFRSSDGGATWSMQCWPERNILGEAPSGDLYVGSDQLFQVKAADETWTSVLANTHIVALAQAPDGALFASATWGGLFKSDNGGQSWRSIDPSLTATALGFDSRGILFGGTDSGDVFRSVDGETLEALPLAQRIGDAIAVRFSAADDVYIVGDEMIAHSADGGDSWSTISSGRYLADMAVAPSGELYYSIYSSDLGTWGSGVFKGVD